MMKSQISAFMDGELLDEETDALLSALKRDETLLAEWTTFHVISDALKEHYSPRRELSPQFSERMKRRLNEEPTVLAPEKRAPRRPRTYALSAAASVAAVAMVFGITLYDEKPGEIAQDSTTAASTRVDDYLLAHQEYSPSTMMQGMAPYVRTVSVARDGK
jgi:sigma-E factor negative regulatory protein RseA